MARGSKFRIKEVEGLTIQVVKTKALINCEVTAQLICGFVFAYANTPFSQREAQIMAELFG